MQRFYGFEVIAGKEHPLKLKAGDGFHLSLVSLPHNCNGHCSLYVSVDGKTYAIATLDSKLSILQACTDLVFASTQDAVFHVNGSGRVNCTGYIQPLLDEEDESSDEDDNKMISNNEGNKQSNNGLPKEDTQDKKAPFGITESDEQAAEQEEEDEQDTDHEQQLDDDDEEDDEQQDEQQQDEQQQDDEDEDNDKQDIDAKEETIQHTNKKAKTQIPSPNRPSQQQQGRPSQQK